MTGGAAAAARFAWRTCRVAVWFVGGLVALDLAVASQARRWEAYDPHPYRERLVGARQRRDVGRFRAGRATGDRRA